MTSRCLVAPGSYRHDHHQRVSCTPESQGVSTSQPMRHRVIRWAGSLAVVCGVSRRHMARLFAVLFLLAMTTSSSTRWSDDMGTHGPPPEERLGHLRALAPATEGPLDGDAPLGTAHGVRVVQEEQARLLMTQEAASETGEDARQWLHPCKDLGRHGTAACSDYAHSFAEAITAVLPPARFQADHFHTVTNLWGHLKKSLLAYRRKVKASGTEQHDEQLLAVAKQLWPLRGSLLKKPAHLSGEDKQASAALEREEAGLVHRFRRRRRPLVHIFDSAPSEAQAQRKLPQRRQEINAVDDDHRQKMLTFFDAHWEQALR